MERDAFVALHEDRLAVLRSVEDRLVFGRLDLDSGMTRYIGRIGLFDDDQRQLLVDWRAPAAESFYQATAASPLGVVTLDHRHGPAAPFGLTLRQQCQMRDLG